MWMERHDKAYLERIRHRCHDMIDMYIRIHNTLHMYRIFNHHIRYFTMNCVAWLIPREVYDSGAWTARRVFTFVIARETV